MSAPTLAVVLGAIAILIFCSALFSRVETALSLLKPHQLRRLEENHAGLTNFIQIFRENPRHVLNVLLLGDGLVNVLLVILCLFFLWEGPLAGRVPQWLAGILIFAIVVLLCDLVPKLVALAAPSKLSAIGAFTLQIAMPFLDRIGRGLESASDYVIDRFTPAHLRSRPRLSDEELGTLLQIGEEEGTLYQGEAEMIQEIIKLGDRTAKDCM
jgi:putative hemolysin